MKSYKIKKAIFSICCLMLTSSILNSQNFVAPDSCILFEDFENRTETENVCSGTINTGNPSGASGPYLGISHGTPRIEFGCPTRNEEKNQGLFLGALKGLCGEGVWLDAKFEKDINYVLSFDAKLMNTIGNVSDFQLVVKSANGIFDNTGNTCSICTDYPPANISAQVIDIFSFDEFAESTCNNFKIAFKPTMNYSQLWFYVKHLNHNSDVGRMLIDNICLEESCLDINCLYFSDPISDIPTWTHIVDNCIETYTTTGCIDTKSTGYTKLVAGEYIHLKPNTCINKFNGPGFTHLQIDPNPCGDIFQEGKISGRLSENQLPNKNVNFRIFPNPSDGLFSLVLDTDGQLSLDNYKVLLKDIIGRTIYESKISNRNHRIDLNVKEGIYILIVYKDGRPLETKKIVVKN